MKQFAIARCALIAVLVGMVFGSGSTRTQAGSPSQKKGTCHHCGRAYPRGQMVECTVPVPMEVCEPRVKPEVVYEQVEREETYTVFRCVPVKRKYYRETCYLADEVKTKEITEEKCHIVNNNVERTYKVQIPEKAIREVLEKKQVCTKNGVECVEVPCTREVTILREETRIGHTTQPQVVIEKTKRTIDYCTKVPKIHREVCTEDTICTLQPVEKTRKVTACVPKIVEREVNVMVCRMVNQQVCCCRDCAKTKSTWGGKGVVAAGGKGSKSAR